MFAYLRGAVASTGSNYVVLDVGGIGFRVMTSWQTLQRLPTPGEFCTLYTHFSVREDAMELFGFDTETELECYEMLTAVTGVGPRVALAILSEFSSDQFALAVASKDAKRLTIANGVGAKLAQRIVMELSDKMTGERFFAQGQDDAPHARPARQTVRMRRSRRWWCWDIRRPRRCAPCVPLTQRGCPWKRLSNWHSRP